ncbi:beta-1,6-galactosyltransferase GALT31A-like isoform X1 [Ananas comosus]|uniref:Hexosyltransferase n=1 Tax=Ananas comosus TaxID=4615 RepID=A0A6P5G2E1_ANACO|nr:beta-1,6-galactosyltransferase GALT31A-like isoform X1 [Ananas comosus]
MGPAAAAAAAARPQKASAAGGVPARWVCALCASCFVFGVFVINRIWSVPEPVKLNEKALFVERTQTRLSEVYIPCQRKQNSIHIGEILNHVSQTHDVIMTLDKTISNLEMRLAAARAARATKQEKSLISADSDIELSKVRPKVFFVMGIITAFSSRKRRDSIRETWMPHGENLRRLEKEKGIVVRFVIGHSGTRGSLLDHTVDAEDEQYSDFLRLDHVEGYHELSSKTLIYFSTAVAIWDADFYIKVDDDVHVNIGVLGSTLARHRSKPRIYTGCMKSGPVLAKQGVKYHEPEYWKFGEEGNKYFRHATGQLYAISKELATYLSVNRHFLHKYANEDVSLGSWFIGLNVEHIDERSLCCGTPPGKHVISRITHTVFSSCHCQNLVNIQCLIFVFGPK